MIMEKKTYITPNTTSIAFAATELLAASRLDSTVGDQTITVSNEEYSGEFNSREFGWSSNDNEWED